MLIEQQLQQQQQQQQQQLMQLQQKQQNQQNQQNRQNQQNQPPMRPMPSSSPSWPSSSSPLAFVQPAAVVAPSDSPSLSNPPTPTTPTFQPGLTSPPVAMRPVPSPTASIAVPCDQGVAPPMPNVAPVAHNAVPSTSSPTVTHVSPAQPSIAPSIALQKLSIAPPHDPTNEKSGNLPLFLIDKGMPLNPTHLPRSNAASNYPFFVGADEFTRLRLPDDQPVGDMGKNTPFRYYLFGRKTNGATKCEWPVCVTFRLNDHELPLERRKRERANNGPHHIWLGTDKPLNLGPWLRVGNNTLTVIHGRCTCQSQFFVRRYESQSERMITMQVSENQIEYAAGQRYLNELLGNASDSQDDDIRVTQAVFSLPLTCPMSFKRIQFPVKGAHCRHVECFDLSCFLYYNRGLATWKCPHCSQIVGPGKLRIDLFMYDLLGKVAKDVRTITFTQDSSNWEVAERDDPDEDEEMTEADDTSRRSSSVKGENMGSRASSSISRPAANTNVISLLSDDEDDENDNDTRGNVGNGGNGDNAPSLPSSSATSRPIAPLRQGLATAPSRSTVQTPKSTESTAMSQAVQSLLQQQPGKSVTDLNLSAAALLTAANAISSNDATNDAMMANSLPFLNNSAKRPSPVTTATTTSMPTVSTSILRADESPAKRAKPNPVQQPAPSTPKLRTFVTRPPPQTPPSLTTTPPPTTATSNATLMPTPSLVMPTFAKTATGIAAAAAAAAAAANVTAANVTAAATDTPVASSSSSSASTTTPSSSKTIPAIGPTTAVVGFGTPADVARRLTTQHTSPPSPESTNSPASINGAQNQNTSITPLTENEPLLDDEPTNKSHDTFGTVTSSNDDQPVARWHSIFDSLFPST
ncbi:hypothetical protein BC940DRAFT_307563 [Gongronella butleri]|nr:hypothetical protein BC940DRAFT_307563 [Gongronella butleri]